MPQNQLYHIKYLGITFCSWSTNFKSQIKQFEEYCHFIAPFREIWEEKSGQRFSTNVNQLLNFQINYFYALIFKK